MLQDAFEGARVLDAASLDEALEAFGDEAPTW